jgi:HAE1 family hydrophobic/amphiphilic exporter-1
VDFIRKIYASGATPLESILTGCGQRLRPVLITSMTTILGMLPIALGTGEGGKILQPLGLVVTGGLWFSMIFTLFLVPLFEYYYLTKISNDRDLEKNSHHVSKKDSSEVQNELFQ